MRTLFFALIGPVSLIAIAPFTIWTYYNGMYPAWQAVRASLLLGMVALLAVGLLSYAARSISKGSLAVTLIISGLLIFYINVAVVCMLIGAFGLVACIDRIHTYRNLNIFASIMGVTLFSGAVWPALQASLENRQVVPSEDALGTIELLQKPSIIHVVLDGYGTSDILSNIYNHDSERFLTALEQRGFVVIRRATTPYNQTLPAMASVLSGGVVDVGSRENQHVLRRDLGHTMSNGPVASVLRDAGYTFTRNNSGYGHLDHSQATSIDASWFGLTELEAMLFKGNPDIFGQVHNTTLKASLEPGLLNNIEAPFFHYQHLLAPHPPFSLNADGSARPVTTRSYLDGSHALPHLRNGRAEYIEGYRQKALFVENALLRQIDAYPEGPKIVLIQGDHGPGAFLNQDSAGHTCMAERLQTFMAFYSNVPNISFDGLLDAEQPRSTVNAYRAIFDRLTADEIPSLADQSYYITWTEPTKAMAVTSPELMVECE